MNPRELTIFVRKSGNASAKGDRGRLSTDGGAVLRPRSTDEGGEPHGGYSQGRTTARRVLLYSERCLSLSSSGTAIWRGVSAIITQQSFTGFLQHRVELIGGHGFQYSYLVLSGKQNLALISFRYVRKK